MSTFDQLPFHAILFRARQLPERVHAQGEEEGSDDGGEDGPDPQVVGQQLQAVS